MAAAHPVHERLRDTILRLVHGPDDGPGRRLMLAWASAVMKVQAGIGCRGKASHEEQPHTRVTSSPPATGATWTSRIDGVCTDSITDTTPGTSATTSSATP